MRTFHQEIGAKRMHELGLGTRNQFADAQAALIYGDLPEATVSAATEISNGYERRAPGSLVGLRAPEEIDNTGALPQPPPGGSSPGPQTRGRMRPRYCRLRSRRTSFQSFFYLPP